MSDPDDSRDLAAIAATGDPVAIGKLVERHLPALHAHIRLKAGPGLLAREETIDLVQSACREVLADLGGRTWMSETEFRQWLFTAAESKLKDRHRYWHAERRDIRRTASPDGTTTGGWQWANLAEAYGPSPSVEAEFREDIDRLEEAFARLTDEEREVILLARVIGASSREIGERLGRTDVAVRKMLSRATARLVRLMRTGSPNGEI